MRKVLQQFALLAALAAAPVAKADLYHFSFTSAKNPVASSFSFDMPSTPSIVYVDPHGYYAETQVLSIEAGGDPIESTTRWSATELEFSSDDYVLTGATPLTGDLSSPTFLLGSYRMVETYDNHHYAGFLVVSNVTPEPASVWLLATGAGGAVVGIRRRRTT